jgi:hypothetical protein
MITMFQGILIDSSPLLPIKMHPPSLLIKIAKRGLLVFSTLKFYHPTKIREPRSMTVYAISI